MGQPGQSAGGLFHAGQQVDHFRVMRPLGRGGMADVYLARDTKLGRKVATLVWDLKALSLERCALLREVWRKVPVVWEDGKAVLARRFDRDGTARRPFLSALALLGTRPGEEGHSYLEIADAIRQFGARVDENLRELWRRMVFNVLVTNTDDHLRNHGFLHEADGWVLSPAYDLNPVPVDVRPRIHALALNEHDPRCSLATVLEVAGYFGLEARHAAGIARSVADATSRWRAVARAQGIDRSGVERMASAFEHEDLDRARRLARS